MALPTYTLDDTDYLDLESLRKQLSLPTLYTKHDEELILVIKAASRMLDDYSGRQWWYQSDRIDRVKPLGQRFFLDSVPIHSITSIQTIDGLHLVESDNIDIESAVTGTIYVTEALLKNGIVDPGITGRINMKTLRANYIVTYASGYETPTMAATGFEYLPFQVRATLLEVAAHIFLSRGENLNIKREHLLESANWYDYAGAEALLARKLGKYGKLRQA